MDIEIAEKAFVRCQDLQGKALPLSFFALVARNRCGADAACALAEMG
jgi:hypothetical protein